MKAETVVWSGHLDHPGRPALPCRVVVRDRSVDVEMDWGSGWRPSNCSSDYYTVTSAAFREMAAGGAHESAGRHR